MRRAGAAWLARVWYPGAAGTPVAPPAVLRAAAGLYALAVRVRSVAYERGLFVPRRLPVACVSVGNLTVGGTGKTPLAIWLAGELAALGARPGMASRGYGGRERGPALVPGGGAPADSARFGDEPVLLAARLPGCPVVVGRDRHAAGMLAAAAGATVVIADDAFQHRRLARDLDIVAVDASRGIGNGRLLPAGPLREPPAALARAGFVVLTRVGEAPDAGALRRALATLAPRAAFAEADVVADGWRDAGGDPVELPAGAGVYAFSGLGNPEGFRRSLAGRGLRLLGWEVFPDHHPYRAAELERLGRAAAASGAAAAVTTAKDAVRIARWPGPAPLYRAEAKLVMIKGREQLWEALKSLAAGGRG